MTLWQTIKWHVIVLISVATNNTTVNFFGSTYIVSGNIVKKIGGKK